MVEPERRSEWITHLWPAEVKHSERIQVLQEDAGSLPFYSRYVAGDERLVGVLQLRNRATAYRAVRNHVYESVRHFLRRRHQVHSRGTDRFNIEAVFGELGVLQLRRV